MDWQTVIISVLSSGVMAALVTGLMNHRTQIQAIKESGLYTKRADVLDEIMKRMERLDRITGELVSPIQAETSDEVEKKRRDDVVDAYNYFVIFYKRNRHYLSKQLSDEISLLCDEYKDLFIDFAYVARIPGENPNIHKWAELVAKHQGSVADKREKMAEEFRKIIGVK